MFVHKHPFVQPPVVVEKGEREERWKRDERGRKG
jgi:hypothetical protein